MSKLPITIATWDYDRVRALADGRVRVEGCDVNYLTMPVEEMLRTRLFPRRVRSRRDRLQPLPDRAVARHAALCRGAGVPVAHVPPFGGLHPHRPRHRRTRRPAAASAIGVPEYQMSAVMWFRGFLQDELRHRGQGHAMGPGRAGKPRPPRQVSAQPAGRLSARRPRRTRTALGDARRRRARRGDLGAPAVLLRRRPSQGRRLFPDYRAAERDYYRQIRHLSDHARGRHPPRRRTRSTAGSPPASTRRSCRPSGSPTRNSPRPPR